MAMRIATLIGSWKRVGASQFGSTELERFWLLDQL
jgi:hypothetical protein